MTIELTLWMQIVLILMFGVCAVYNYRAGTKHGIHHGVNTALDFLAKLKMIKMYPNGSVRGLATKIVRLTPNKAPEDYE
jgi:hypothetical protein